MGASIAGLLTPATRIEDERIGAVADEVKASAAEVGHEALDRGKQVVQEVSQTAIDTAKERGREEGEELASSLQDKARETVPTEKQTTAASPTQPTVPRSPTPQASRTSR